jgi:ribulose-5-phosphate 4-epimerase/fuculose-1-phosphate aldolase
MNVLEELGSLGRELGALRWVQGPGGNVSIKADGELVVKASGVRLRDVAGGAGHARVPLDEARRALEGDAGADARLFARKPRPSLETYFHALDGRIVAHTHALGVLLYACSSRKGPRPEGVTGEVAYARPGRGVALAMKDVLVDAEEQAIVLLSHGVVVIAETAARAAALTLKIDDLVRARFGDLPALDVAPYMVPACATEGGVFRPLPSRASSPRYLFPDAVICASVLLVDSLRDAAPLAARSIAETGGRAHVLSDADGQRALVAKNETQLDQSAEVLAAHDWLEDALGGQAEYLPKDEPLRLLDLPSEQYRIRLLQG